MLMQCFSLPFECISLPETHDVIGNLGDKIICDLDQTPDLSQRSLQNCPKCGNTVDGHYCQGCALLRNKFKEDVFTSCVKNEILQDSSNPSNDNTNVVNAPREPFIVNEDPGKNSSQSPPQTNHHCCYGCGDPLEGIFFHQCTCELCRNGAHYGYNCPSKLPIIPNSEPSTIKPLRSSHQLCQVLIQHATLKMGIHSLMIPHLILFMILLTFSTHLRNFLFIIVNFAGMMLVMVTIVHLKFSLSIRNRVTIKTLISRKIFMIFNNKIFVVKISREAAKTRYWKILACYDDDDNDYTIAITHKEPDNSLSMGDEHPDTVSATESDEFIKSSVENLVPNPSESEGENKCDVPTFKVFTTFSNILFDADFYSVDDQLFSDEDIPKEIYSNPLFDEEIISMKIDPHHFNAESDLIESLLNHNSLIIPSSLKIDSLFDEFAGELTLLKSIPPGINETDCDLEEETHFIKRLLYDNTSPRPPKEFVFENSDTAIESFSHLLSPLRIVTLSWKKSIYLLLWITQCRRALRKITMTLKWISLSLKNCLAMIPFHFLKMSHFILIFLHHLALLQNHQMEKSPDLLPHLGHEAFQPSTECPMMIYGKNTPILDVPFFHFYPP
nr:hypothetical protein [Tanacetum cinerariifolium]